MASCSAYELAGKLGGGLLLRDWLGIGRVVVGHWGFFHLHHLSFLGFIFLSVIFLYYNFYYVISIIKLSLSQRTSFLTFTLPVLFPLILLGAASERLRGV